MANVTQVPFTFAATTVATYSGPCCALVCWILRVIGGCARDRRTGGKRDQLFSLIGRQTVVPMTLKDKQGNDFLFAVRIYFKN